MFIFSQLSTALMSFSIGDVSPRFPFLTCRCYGSKMNLVPFKAGNSKVRAGDTTLFVELRLPVLQTAPTISTYIHPQKLGGPG